MVQITESTKQELFNTGRSVFIIFFDNNRTSRTGLHRFMQSFIKVPTVIEVCVKKTTTNELAFRDNKKNVFVQSDLESYFETEAEATKYLAKMLKILKENFDITYANFEIYLRETFPEYAI